MRVIVFVKATASSEAGVMPSERLLTEMGAYNVQLVKAGIMKDGAGLKPSTQGVRVRFSGAERTVINGPFAETKELVSGYWLWEVASMEQAIEWIKKCPNPMPEVSEIEIRPFFEAEDFGKEYTPELRAQESQLLIEASMQQASVQPYLFFNGRCDEALKFYQSALHAKIAMILRFNESPEPAPPGMLQPGFEQKIMHCEFAVGSMILMGSDGCGEPSALPARNDGFRLALTVPNEATADQVFNALAIGGKIDMPLTKTFWSPRYGMVTDPFGIGWMVMVPGIES